MESHQRKQRNPQHDSAVEIQQLRDAAQNLREEMENLLASKNNETQQNCADGVSESQLLADAARTLHEHLKQVRTEGEISLQQVASDSSVEQQQLQETVAALRDELVLNTLRCEEKTAGTK